MARAMAPRHWLTSTRCITSAPGLHPRGHLISYVPLAWKPGAFPSVPPGCTPGFLVRCGWSGGRLDAGEVEYADPVAGAQGSGCKLEPTPRCPQAHF